MSPSSVNINNLTGKQGGDVINDGAAHTLPSGQNYNAILVVQQAVIAASTGNLGNAVALNGVSLPPGLVLFGRFSSITLTSGTVIAYKE